MTNREQMAAGLMIAMGMVLIWWVSTPSPPEEPVEPPGAETTDPPPDNEP